MATRFAPSMTGYLHLGHLYHLIWVYAYANKMNLSVYLRIEDHDITRARPEYEGALFADLKTFGFKWSGEFLRQSDHQNFYKKQLEVLKEAQLVYGCDCSRKEILKNQNEKAGEFFYCEKCLDKRLPLKGNTVRFKVSKHNIKFKDQRLGWQTQKPSNQCGDFAIRDRTGQYTYQFCCVCDDIKQGISHVVRGEDLLESTARQIQLFNAFNARVPDYFHHPLLYDKFGKKLSKRNHDESLRAQLENQVHADMLIAKALGKKQAMALLDAIRFISTQINLFA